MPARSRGRGDRSEASAPVTPLVAAAQIALGATLSCLLAVLSLGVLGAVILLIAYLAR